MYVRTYAQEENDKIIIRASVFSLSRASCTTRIPRTSSKKSASLYLSLSRTQPCIHIQIHTYHTDMGFDCKRAQADYRRDSSRSLLEAPSDFLSLLFLVYVLLSFSLFPSLVNFFALCAWQLARNYTRDSARSLAALPHFPRALAFLYLRLHTRATRSYYYSSQKLYVQRIVAAAASSSSSFAFRCCRVVFFPPRGRCFSEDTAHARLSSRERASGKSSDGKINNAAL